MSVISGIRNAALSCRNALCGFRREGLEWIVLPIGGSYPELTLAPSLPFPLSRLLPYRPETSLDDIRQATERLGADHRVRGVVLRVDGLRAGMAAIHALRGVVRQLRADGKRVVAWLPDGDMADYYLASACDEVIMPPSARLYLVGLWTEVTFLKDMLARVGVEADFETIAEYKTAADMFRRSTMTEPHHEMLAAILDSYFDELVAAIAERPGLGPGRVRELIDQMPLTAAGAMEAGLVDGLLYEDELPARLLGQPQPVRARRHTGVPARLNSWEVARSWLRRPLKRMARQAVAVIAVEGLIVRGESRRFPFPVPIPMIQSQAGADTICQALRRAEADDRVAAVVLCVDSPGGSSLASDLIAREVRRLRERKPVVVLMGDQAASGGYYIAAAANHIVARPTTLTGSIGIFAGKFALAGLYDKLGVNRQPLQRGRMAGLFSDLAPFSEEERAWLRRDLGEAYSRFKAVVAEGRRMTEEQVEEIARGRVWTGAQALELGLVDELGDFAAALERAKELAGIDPRLTPPVARVEAGKRMLTPPGFPDGARAPALLCDTLHALSMEHTWALAHWLVHVRS